jgi:hypothetical protein
MVKENFMVRAKFKVDKVESTLQQRKKNPAGGWESENIQTVEMRTVVLSPVYGNGDPQHENTKFWNATPAGEIRLGTINPEAWSAFELGAEVYVDFTPVK